MVRYRVGKNASCARDHAICDGPIVVAVVQGNGYPAGKGWAPDSAALAQRIVALLNAAEPGGAICEIVALAKIANSTPVDDLLSAMPIARVQAAHKSLRALATGDKQVEAGLGELREIKTPADVWRK